MKVAKIWLFLSILFLVTNSAEAVPARPGIIKIVQADGSVISIIRHGDDFFHYTTTIDGHIIAQKNGIYYHAEFSPQGKIRISDVRANDRSQRSSAEHIYLTSKSSTNIASFAPQLNSQRRQERRVSQTNRVKTVSGKTRGIVLLVEYPDRKFLISNTKEHFTNMLNQKGYKSIGSAKDYFKDNSGGIFDPDFDVSGIITTDNNMAYYSANDTNGDDLRARDLVAEVCRKASLSGVNFSQYDTNNDGIVDNVFVYFAGYNEAEGGSEDTIWPHSWSLSNMNLVLNGKRIYSYACSSELKGSSGINPAGIGTFCHEFGHVLGLCDLYDTNYSTNGTAKDLETFDLMASGNYCGEGDYPAALSAVSLIQIGWCEMKPIDNLVKSYVLDPSMKRDVYRINTDVTEEFFLVENRNNSAFIWDKWIGAEGLFVYHVDRSAGYIERWNSNIVNAYDTHPCAYVVSSSGMMSPPANIPFPGTNNKATKWSATSYPSNKSWSGQPTGIDLLDIQRNGQKITFKAGSNIESNLNGKVVDLTLKTIVGAEVLCYGSDGKLAAKAVTDSEGDFLLLGVSDGTYTIKVDMKGYLLYNNSHKIAKGDYLSIKLFTEESVRLKYNVSQISATFYWEPMNYTSWIIKWGVTGSGVITSAQTNVNRIEILDLLPNKEYTVSIEGYDSATKLTEKIVEKDFKTVVRKSNIPIIQLKYNYMVGEEIPLIIYNINGDDSVEWSVNGTKQSEKWIKPAVGKHEIKCVVTQGDKKITVTRKIEVK